MGSSFSRDLGFYATRNLRADIARPSASVMIADTMGLAAV
jgi:hypothetical protein